jgi:KipI family sensor histidine kinase inhibitor
VRLRRAGPYATSLQLDEPPSPATSRRLARLRERLARSAPPEVRDVVPGFASLLIEHRPTLTPRTLHAWLAHAGEAGDGETSDRLRTLRVAYGLDADTAELEAALALPFDSIARLHREHEATVAFVGFTPGFPYLAGLPEALALPRRERPRTRIPAGAVAIAAGRGGVYPAASPGGWWVLGRTDAVLFDPYRDEPAWLAPGDRLRFEPVRPSDLAPAGATAPPPREALDAPALEVLDAVPGSASLQAAPRHGGGHLGLAQTGALDPLARDAANAMVGNARGAAVMEAIGQPVTMRAEEERLAAVAGGGMALALDGRPVAAWRAFRWPKGSVLELLPDRAVRGRTAVLAVAGGLLGERWRGSDSTDVRAGAGGSRRWLAPGDRIALGGAPPRPAVPHPGRPRHPERIALRLHPGPQYDAGAFDALVSRAFRLDDADRTGARLDGPPLAELPTVESDGSPLGALQIPPDGHPIVLLNDRGRTGGYPKPAVVDPRDLWRLAQARAGDEVWLVDARVGDDPWEPLDFGP